MKKKKYLSLLLAALVGVSMAGCSVNQPLTHNNENASNVTDKDVQDALDEGYTPAPWGPADEDPDDMSPVEEAAESSGNVISGVDLWGFKNYSSDDKMNDTVLTRLLSNLSGSDRTAVKREYVSSINNPSGRCYGMALTAILCNNGVTDPRHFDPTATSLYKAKAKNNYSTQAINFYFVQQVLGDTRTKGKEFMNRSNADQISILQKAGISGKTFAVCFAYDNGKRKAGHAVMGYGLESGSWVYNDNVYTSRIPVYDSNNPDLKDKSRSIYLNVEKGIWCIPAYNAYSTSTKITDGDSKDNAELMRVITKEEYVNLVDYATGATSSLYTGIQPPNATVNNKAEVTVESPGGKAVFNGAAIKESSYKGKNGICAYYEMSDKSDDTVILFPENEAFYRIDSGKEDLDVVFTVGATSISVKSDSSGEFTVKSDGSVDVACDNENANTTVEMTTDTEKYGIDGSPETTVCAKKGSELHIEPSGKSLKVDASPSAEVSFTAEQYGQKKKMEVRSDSNNLSLSMTGNKAEIKEDGKILAVTSLPKPSVMLSLKDKTAVYTGKSIAIGKAKVKGKAGNIVYTYYSDKKCKKPVKNHTDAGTYYVKAQALAGNQYVVKSKPAKLVVKKSGAAFSLKKPSITFKKGKVKQRAQTVMMAVTGKGKFTYRKTSGSGNITVSSNGKVTVKKGTRAGTYKIGIKITSKNYAKQCKKTIIVKIK